MWSLFKRFPDYIIYVPYTVVVQSRMSISQSWRKAKIYCEILFMVRNALF